MEIMVTMTAMTMVMAIIGTRLPTALTTDTRQMDKEVVMAMMTGHGAEWDTLSDNMIGWNVQAWKTATALAE